MALVDTNELTDYVRQRAREQMMQDRKRAEEARKRIQKLRNRVKEHV